MLVVGGWLLVDARSALELSTFVASCVSVLLLSILLYPWCDEICRGLFRTRNTPTYHLLFCFFRRNETSTLRPLVLGVLYDASSTYDLDNDFDYNSRRDNSGIMPWDQWEYLMEKIVEGGPAYYGGGEAEW